MMNKGTKLTIALLFALATPILSLAQGTKYDVPNETELEKVIRQTFPEYFGGEFPHLIPETFFPIGWSRDGKFAYYTEPVDEACGCYFARLVIQDLRTDKILWEFKYNQGDLVDENGNMPPEDTIEKLWEKNKKLFSDKLKEYGIRQTKEFDLLGKTFSSGGRKYTASVSRSLGNDEDGTQRIKNISAFLSSPTLGKKEIYSENFEANLFAAPLDTSVIGVLKSPFENRTAIVLIVVRRGWEGPPHTADIRIVGADLFSGFGKK